MKKLPKNEYNLTPAEIMESINDLRNLTLDFIVRESTTRQNQQKSETINCNYIRTYGINNI